MRAPGADKARAPIANRLLAALPAPECDRFVAETEAVELRFGEVLYVPGQLIRSVFFPIGGFVSLAAFVDGSSAGLEVDLIGCEGMVGNSLVLGVDHSPLRATVQGPGTALRMSAASFRHRLAQSASLQRGLHRYLFVSMAELAQTIACTRFHSLEARLARWLMTTSDRARSDQFRLTHELLAHKLGVRRVGVTAAAGALQRRKLIGYSRGHITLLDRSGLQAVACECYRSVRAMREHILA